MSKPWPIIGAWALETERAEAEERELANKVQIFSSLKEAATKSKKKKLVLTLSEFTAGNYAGREARLEGQDCCSGGGIRSRGYGSEENAADEVDNWSSVKKHGEGERPRLVLDPPKRGFELQQVAARSRPNPFSDARPREEVLAEKGLDWRKMENEIGMKKAAGGFASRPSSGQSSRPGSSGSQASEGGVLNLRPKVNPFGDAKPREVVLEEKGLDWRKIDQELEHCRIDRHVRPETDEEKKLKEEIDQLKKELGMETESNLNGDSSHHPTEEFTSLLGQIRKREKELENLICQFDDKLCFGHQAFGDARPNSVSGRPMIEKQGFQLRRDLEDSRHTGFVERPRSRGTDDSWSRPMIEKRGFQSSRDFEDSRQAEFVERPRSREMGDSWSRPMMEKRGFQSSRDFEDSRQIGFVERPRSRGMGDSWSRPMIEKRAFQSSRDFEDSRQNGYVEMPRSRGTGDSWSRPMIEKRGFQSSRDFEDSRQNGFVERPRSRGTGDSWSRPMIEKRGFQSSRDSGFLGRRNMDRSKSGERW